MQFLYPAFLWALLLLAIPIIIHLFNFRRYKTIYFSNTRFLKEIKEDKAARSKVKHLLVLFSRLMAVAFLVFAFAQPFLPEDDTEITTGSNHISIYVDNSFSMQVEGVDRPLFQEAVAGAEQIALESGPNDRFQLLTNDFEGRHQRFVSRDEFLELLEEVEITPVSRTLGQVLNRQADAFSVSGAESYKRFILSDFQRSFVEEVSDTSHRVYLIPIKSEQAANILIDTVWMNTPVVRPGEAAEVIVRIRRYGEGDSGNNRLTLSVNDETKAISDFRIEGSGTLTDTVFFTVEEAGWHKARLSINDYPIDFDDHYYFSFNVKDRSNVLLIYENNPGRFLSPLFTAETYFQLDNRGVRQLDYSTIQQYDFIVLEHLNSVPTGLSNALETFVNEGGNVFLFPAREIDLSAYNQFLRRLEARPFQSISESRRNVNVLNTESDIFRQVFESVPENISLPTAHKHYTIGRAATNEIPVLEFRRGEPFVSQFRKGLGNLYVSAVPLHQEWTDFQQHAIIVPLMINAALGSTNRYPTSYVIGKSKTIDLDVGLTDTERAIRLSGNDYEIIPGQMPAASRIRLYLEEDLPEAGFYSLDIPEQSESPVLAFNYDRSESEMSFVDAATLRNYLPQTNFEILEVTKFAEIQKAMVSLNFGSDFWKWCIAIALLFLAFEILLLRLWKK
ncbi:MAG: hypothetical protein EA412_10580 [Chitinophagaceae bacterium]|nr:MAG: hypothetical protein EA412_10580 [Chitinophagaceae bacterium]